MISRGARQRAEPHREAEPGPGRGSEKQRWQSHWVLPYRLDAVSLGALQGKRGCLEFAQVVTSTTRSGGPKFRGEWGFLATLTSRLPEYPADSKALIQVEAVETLGWKPRL